MGTSAASHPPLLRLTGRDAPHTHADKGGDPELVRESQRRRFADVSLVDQVIALDAEWRAVRYELDSHQKDLNSISKEVGQIKKVCMHARAPTRSHGAPGARVVPPIVAEGPCGMHGSTALLPIIGAIGMHAWMYC